MSVGKETARDKVNVAVEALPENRSASEVGAADRNGSNGSVVCPRYAKIIPFYFILYLVLYHSLFFVLLPNILAITLCSHHTMLRIYFPFRCTILQMS